MSTVDIPNAERIFSEDSSEITPNETSSRSSEDDFMVGARSGTITSATFNMLCTMVGGGCLSLPMAFQQSGSALLAPVILLLMASISQYCFYAMVSVVEALTPASATERKLGKHTYDSLTAFAFGPIGLIVSKWVVFIMCWSAVLAYCILLRDMLVPVVDSVFPSSVDGLSLRSNSGMLIIIILMTPVCTLETLSPLKKTGALSMSAIVLLGICLVYRSTQCNLGYYDGITHGVPWSTLQWWPTSAREVLNALPIFSACYVCHYNIPLVHNELQNPTKQRVSWWLFLTVWSGTAFYVIIGIAGSAYGHCTETGKVQGNILLDFDESDPLLYVARLSLAVTITLAFPLLVVPARHILLQTFFPLSPPGTVVPDLEENLEEPLLEQTAEQSQESSGHSFMKRLLAAMVILWSSAALGSCVESIAVVWDLVGSSMSILVSYLIPCGAYIIIVCQTQELSWLGKLSKSLSWALIIFFFPMMFISTTNAVVNAFFANE